MTSTPVKDANLLFTGLTSAMGSRASGIGQNGFQAVLNNQTQKNTGNQAPESRPVEARTAVKRPDAGTKAEEPADTGDIQEVQHDVQKGLPEGDGEEVMTPEELEEAMAVLQTAAVELIQQAAELLGIPVEELQSLMDDLGMETLDILDPKQLGALFLQAGGVEDSYALVTDEGLYEDYQTLMKQLDTVLQECGEKLDKNPAQISMLLEKPEVQNAASLTEVSEERQFSEGKIPERELPETGEMTIPDNTVVNTPKAETDNGSRQEHREDTPDDSKEQPGGNIFLQNVKAGEFQPEVQQAEEPAGLAETEQTENIMRQIMDYMKVQLKADTTNLEMQLHPASLGTVQVQLASRGGAVTANFITQNEAVKAALESQMAQLIERFDEQGVKVEAVEVTVQTHEFERNLEQGQGRGQQNEEPARKGRTRRIDLNDALSMENMEEEDALAAEMMAANGNTVDYTA